MAQVDVRLSRKPNKIGERTEASIILKIHMDSACTCGVLEITMKLVNRIKLVTPHMVRATNMRMIICFMIFLSSGFAHLKRDLYIFILVFHDEYSRIRDSAKGGNKRGRKSVLELMK
jgi:hypothetical protein